jgi:hypothetical protein
VKKAGTACISATEGSKHTSVLLVLLLLLLLLVVVQVNAFLGTQPRVVATTRHTWQDNAAGTALIRMRTQLWIGLMDIGSSTTFNTSTFAGSVNDFISYQIMGGTSDLSSMNATALGYMNALHFIEEYGGTRSWLPAVWRARTRR